MQPALHVVALAGLGEARRLLARQVEAIELRRLVAAAAALEDDVVAVDRLVASLGHRLAAVGQRLGLGERAGDAEDLRRVDAGAAMRDEHLAPRRVPVHEPMAAKVGVARDGAGDARRHRRDALDDQVGVGNDDVAGRRRRLRRRQGCAGTEERHGRRGRGESRNADGNERHRREKGRRLDGSALIVMRRAGAARGRGTGRVRPSGRRRLLDAGDRPLAAAVGRLDEVPDLVERLGDAVVLFADQAVEADADDLALGLARDVEHLGVDADDVGALRPCAALLQVELDRREHLGRREGAQVVEVGAVVRRLHADEDHLGDALEGRRRRSRRAGWPRRSAPALRQASRRVARRQSARAVRPRPAASRGTAPAARRGTTSAAFATGAPAPASCMPPLAAAGFDGMKRRIRKRTSDEGGDRQQHHHDDVAELGAEAEVAHQRGDAEAGGEAGDRAHPRATRRGRGGSARGGRSGGLRDRGGGLGRHRVGGARGHAALHAGGAAAADAARVGDVGHGGRGGDEEGECQCELLHCGLHRDGRAGPGAWRSYGSAMTPTPNVRRIVTDARATWRRHARIDRQARAVPDSRPGIALRSLSVPGRPVARESTQPKEDDHEEAHCLPGSLPPPRACSPDSPLVPAPTLSRRPISKLRNQRRLRAAAPRHARARSRRRARAFAGPGRRPRPVFGFT